jgi:hypothetical protein
LDNRSHVCDQDAGLNDSWSIDQNRRSNVDGTWR